jgi:hypothetical protein
MDSLMFDKCKLCGAVPINVDYEGEPHINCSSEHCIMGHTMLTPAEWNILMSTGNVVDNKMKIGKQTSNAYIYVKDK